MYFYTAYGLDIASELELPELMPADQKACSTGRRPVRVEYGAVDLQLAEGSEDVLAWARPGDACLNYEGVGVFHVIDGKSVRVDPVSGADARAIRLYLLGPALSLLLHQRGLLVLHASAVAIDGQVVAFVGEKGEGKSTLAAAMMKRGHPLVSDDLLPIDLHGTAPVVVPGFPQLKLMPDALEHLGEKPNALPQLHPDSEKRGAPATNFAPSALPLSRIFVLCRSLVNRTEPIAPQERVIELIRHSYLAGLLQTTGESAAHFGQVVHLARRVPVLRLGRRWDLQSLLESVQRVEDETVPALACP
jgi:hypothetical protein